MINIKNKKSIAKMEEAAKRLVAIFEYVTAYIKPGITTQQLNDIIDEQLKHNGMVSRTKGYMGYKHASCISVNDELVHGVPSVQKKIKKGDLVKVDVCASWKGYCADMARAFYVGETTPESIKCFVDTAQRALDKGIEQARPGNRLSDISAAIQHEVEKEGFGVVRDFAGHGIGKQMHEDPEILNYGEPGQGPTLRPGMTFAIEPMITMGKYDVYITDDKWTVRTTDKSLATHVEDTILVTESRPKILTRNLPR